MKPYFAYTISAEVSVGTTANPWPSGGPAWAIAVSEGTEINVVLSGGGLFSETEGATNRSVSINTCAGDAVQTIGVLGPEMDVTLDALPAGEYIIAIAAVGPTGASTVDFSCTITATAGAFAILPLVVGFNEDSEVRFLQACPRLELPLSRFEDPDPTAVYADKTAATTALTTTALTTAYPSVFVRDCTVVARRSNPITINSLGFASNTVSMNATQDSSQTGTAIVEMWVAVQLVAGDTFNLAGTVSWTGAGGTPSWDFYICTQAGDFLEHIYDTNATSDTLDLDYVVPATGVYYIYFDCEGGGGTGSRTRDVSIALSSSGDMQVGTVQALYDRGVDCPARLECADA